MSDYFVWNIDPLIFSIGSIGPRWYSVLFASGFIAGFYFMRSVFRHENKPEEKLDSLLIYLVLGTVIGARLGHTLIYEPVFYLSHPIEILKIWEGGLASHGGGIGVLIAIYLFCRKHGFNYMWLADRLAVPVALTGTFIRLGNFFNSEILGTATNVPWAVIFSRIDQVPRHPVQLYESFSYALCFVILYSIYKKSNHQPKPGMLLGTFLIMVFTARFLLEGFKMKQAAYDPGALHMGQWLSIPFLITGIVLVIRALTKPAKPA